MPTTKQVAKRLGVSQRRVTALIKAGKLKAKKIGRDWLIKESDLKELKIEKKYRGKKEP